MIEGGATDGYCATGSLATATPPSTRMNRAITHAKTGRSMKNLAMLRLQGLAAAGAEAGAATGAPPGDQGTGLTGALGRSFWKPSTITCSPAFRPSRMTHWPD